jgi:hypothetical protein
VGFLTFPYKFQIDDGTIFKKDYIKNIDAYVLTLYEWFQENKRTIKK